MIGTTAVYDWLQPFVDGTNSSLTDMKILHQVSEDSVVMNAREETWQRHDICVMTPVAGLFVIEDDLITRYKIVIIHMCQPHTMISVDFVVLANTAGVWHLMKFSLLH